MPRPYHPRCGAPLLQVQFSSGDLVADRRASYAAALADAHAYGDAAELMAQTLELVPDWAAGWNLLGDYRQKAGDTGGAIAAWRELLQRDTTGVFGARLKLAAHGVIPDLRPAPEYVEALFDDYAPRFEQSLVEKLGYRTPELIADVLRQVMAERGIGKFARAIDLGCGTGLMGEHVRELTARLDGIDLSGRMLAQARRKGIYDDLVQADLIAWLNEAGGAADLVLAADVFNYVGDLEPPLAAARRVLQPGGLVVFSLETHAGHGAVKLAESLRFQHSAQRAVELCASLGLDVMRVEESVIRQDRGQPVAGVIVVATG